jgi:uncharacterized membrane protein
VSSAQFKERVFWTSVVVFYASGVLLALSIYWRTGLLPIVAAAAWWVVTLAGMHAMHEAHASAPISSAQQDRFRKPEGPRREGVDR